ncbi:hypothetical protein K493DRAFT_313113 [Basidiobolus meristosporus CBS 931.73]|uniref:RNI-like protein n=1 Tax=Basidiobolus meristosporus CBS 931.73 TaxID=1314790 RepID=A0A1Y1YPQ0_9FUNG|nr:hypothetical protein K493DRAFT_313113 [Basidiobolus meristosporus CBS 931.73]|eukprot:ORX99736.1 hypothetical protein K493DRAFT_313113 [Basidiobolus meristosporus CBS 931.73]
MYHLKQLTIEFEDFDTGGFGATFIQSVTRLTPNLKYLGLKTGTFIGHTLLGVSECCARLESLSLEYWNDPVAETMSLFVQELSNGLGSRLRHFSVIQRGGFISPAVYQGVWPLMSSLQSLHLWGVGLNEESFRALTKSSQFLSRLTFYRSPSSDGLDGSNLVSHSVWGQLFSVCASNLVELNLLAFRPFPSSVSQVISEECVNLKSLSITSESAEFVCPILRACGPQLTSLELMGCKLGIETLNTVFRHCHTLTKLVFMHPEIGGTRPLVQQQNVQEFLQQVGPKLRSFILSGTSISSVVLEEIRTHCIRLNHLDLTQVVSIDEKSAVAHFKASLMHLKWIKINGTGTHSNQKPPS